MDLRNKILFTAGLLWFFAFTLTAQEDKPLMSTGDLQFYVDKAVFAGSEGKSYAEFYFMFFADQIDFSEDNKGEIDIELLVNDQAGKKVSEREWRLEVVLEDNKDIRTKVFYDQAGEYLLPGDYKLQVTALDINSKLKGKLGGKFEVESISSSSFSSSDIEFVSSASADTSSSHFRKGSKKIIANPSRRYGILNPILYFYYELYNITTDTAAQMNVDYTISAVNSEYRKDFPEVKINKTNSTAGIMHGLNVGNLPSGVYKLNITVTDPENDVYTSLARDFEIIQMDFAGNKSAVSEEDAEVFEKIISIIGTDAQLSNFRKLSPEGKGAYMIEYWKNADPSPGTPENEYLQKIQQRFSYANKRFGWGNTEGWRTERGRVLIKYGNPDELQQHHSEADMYPYEIWVYNQERRFIFVFGDLTNNGKYVLLHSDKEGEISNERWKDYLQKI